MSLAALTLTEAAAHIRDGRIKSAELVHDCLARIGEVDADVQAWAFLDRDLAMRQAEAADLHRMQGKSLGPLHGVPVGIKDILDTNDMPTEFGSPVWAGRTPRQDAFAVARLRADGADYPRQDRYDGIRVLSSGEDPKPARSRAHARRLVERLGGGGGRLHGAGLGRNTDEWLGHPSRGLLRRCWLQADARTGPAFGSADDVAQSRSDRSLCPLGRRRGTAGGIDCWLRRRRSGYPPGGEAAVCVNCRVRTAAAATLRVRQIAGVGSSGGR